MSLLPSPGSVAMATGREAMKGG